MIGGGPAIGGGGGNWAKAACDDSVIVATVAMTVSIRSDFENMYFPGQSCGSGIGIGLGADTRSGAGASWLGAAGCSTDAS